MHISRSVRTGGRLGLLIGLGVVAALLMLSFMRSDPLLISSLIRPPVLGATRGGATGPTVPDAAALEQTPPSSAITDDELLAPTEPDPPLATASQALGTPIETSSDLTGAPALVSVRNTDQGSVSSEAPEKEVEYPLGWCFRTRPGGVGPWLAASPPDEPTHGLTSDSGVVWNGSRSARLGSEEYGRGFAVDVMWQAIDATAYRGSRIEFSAWFQGRAFFLQFFLRTLRATDAELVLIDYTRPNATPRNLMWSGIAETWMHAQIVDHIPADADLIVFGIAIYSGGHAWIVGVQLATVAENVPLTHRPLEGGIIIMPLPNAGSSDMPTNLDFEATNLEAGGLPSELVGC